MSDDNLGPYGFNFDLDFTGSRDLPSAYRAVDMRDGRYAVFLVHRATREWWRLVAVFSTWERADRYAGVENDCMESNFKAGNDHRIVYPLVPVNEAGRTEISPAPETLPPEPPSGLRSPAEAATDDESPYAKLWTRNYSQTLPLSDRLCARDECGYRIPSKRAENKNTKYCSPECADAATKERLLAKKTPTIETVEDPPPKEPDRSADESQPEATAEQPEEPSETWTDERISLLRQLVGEGISYAEIGNRLGVTKNAALGKASRLGITPPAKTEGDEIARFIAERGVTKLPPDPRLSS